VPDTVKNGIYAAAVRFSHEKTWFYDAGYYAIPYPGGDVPSGGACTDVVIRVLRENKIDLQQLIHEDMRQHFSAYPNKWAATAPDPNIDHRRVPNIMTYFERKRYALPLNRNISDYHPGDIVTWELSPGVTHIGICLKNGDIYHNIGPWARIDKEYLFTHKLIGHYRVPVSGR
jgi:uncharacterized protein YijF (DUF1287 family)